MLFSRQLPLGALITLCRALRHSLGAGLSLVQVFRQQTERGVARIRPLAGRILASLEQGHGLADTLEAERDTLPPLFLALVKVGEDAGHLAEVFGELEKYYQMRLQLRKQLRSQSMMPVIQLVMAFLILAGLIFILGLIGSASRSRPVALFGLSGTSGAFIFLAASFGSIGGLWLLAKILAQNAQGNPKVDAFLLRIPVFGPCLEALVMGRFTMALHMTMESAMPIARALRLSLAATGNAAFTRQTDTVTSALKNGQTLVEALTRSGLFSVDFLSLVAVGEEGGRLPEVMRQQADYWNEESAQRLKIATRLAGLLIWLVYAGFMIWAIFSIAGVYFGALGGI